MTVTPPRTEPTASSRRWRAGRELVIIVVVALLLTTTVRTFVVQAFFIPSVSMQPTLQVDDRVLVSRITGSDVNRGQPIVFTDPGGWLPPTVPGTGPREWLRSVLRTVGLLPSDSGEHLVKRVIGVGGDRVVCCDPKGRIEVNGVAITEPYVAPGRTDQVRFDVRVPAGRFFVMGDNRGDSEDSRFHLSDSQGTIPASSVTGPVTAVVWPPGRWQGSSDGSPSFARVPARAPGARPAPSKAPTAEAVP